ncbi:hypothetical protein Y1Q_0005919 [Alligator mississippiensis]|uniref:Uncharacterized protein n=1 Tax=Alligator mississippiensis TaxID=8496 RepID=A0A151P6F9_ALLMI|nr:hypothetical protein Y1Q_0005919 [Alligator mississippiensis]
MQQPLLKDAWLTIALLKLATPASLYYMDHFFGIGKATTKEVVLEVCSALQNMLGHTVRCMHDPLEVMVRLCALGFPQFIGALNGAL